MLILASTSQIRQTLLKRAGLSFQALPPRIDEKQLQDQFKNQPTANLARTLAEAKSKSLGVSHPQSVIIGVDQTLVIEGKLLHKPETLQEAKDQLLEIRGKTHMLTSAICCSIAGTVIWSFDDQAKLTVRAFSDQFLSYYLEQVKHDILGSVGSYKLEAEGIQLFEKIDGDYFTILGFPLLPLLSFLRTQGMITT